MDELPTDITSIGPVSDKPARQWAMVCHATGLVTFLGLPFGNIVVPLIVWLLKKDVHPFVDESGKESLNFQISMTIYGLIAGVLCFLLVGFVLLGLLVIADIVFVIKATLAADKGLAYRYPFTIRFLK